MQPEHNILIGAGVLDPDKELFFGPLTPRDTFQHLPEDMTWADLLVSLKLFPSKGQARKASPKWNEPIPEGWTEVTVGKLKTRICILKIS